MWLLAPDLWSEDAISKVDVGGLDDGSFLRIEQTLSRATSVP